MSETTRHRGAASATLAGIIDALSPRTPGVGLADDVSMRGRTVLVTGASRGLGLGISKDLARRGAHVIMAMRSRLEEAVDEVRADVPGCHVEGRPVVLDDPASIAALAQGLADDGVHLDVLVCNAGVVPARSRTTDAGLDIMVHVNFVANVQLVRTLIAQDTFGCRDGSTPRIVVVGSEAHRSSPSLDLAHWSEPRTYGTAQVMAEYGRSKLLLHTWVCELTRRLDGPDGPRITVAHLCPGAIASNIAREAPAWSKGLLHTVMGWFFQSPATAAKPVVYLACAPELEGRTGTYLHMDQVKAPSADAMDPEQGAALWTEAHALVDRLLES